MPGLQTINLGTAGSQSGDVVRDAFGKCNENFTYLDDYKPTGSDRGGIPPIREIFIVDDKGTFKLHLITADSQEWEVDAALYPI